jgi:zinc and cadmium transporter
MTEVWLYSLISVLVVSLFSLIGALVLFFKLDKLKKILPYFVSFSAGALLGGVFIHLLPEIAQERGFTLDTSLLVLLGILIFFVLEKIICWRHCHIPTSEEHPHTLGVMNLIGDGLHNFTDGVIISASFMTSLSLGLATTLAVIFHEIPQEIGDFSVLIYAGYSKGKALLFNLLTALMAVIGAVITLTVFSQIEAITYYLIPLTAGGFIYIASSDLIPELKKEQGLKKSFLQLLGLLTGVLIMWLIKQD